jgi:poly(hydroxyalkanoate) granule-associated protein
MAARKKVVRSRVRHPGRSTRLERTWSETRQALRSAEATVGKRVAALVERSGLEPKQVMRQAEAWRSRLDREGKKARKRVEARIAELRQRARVDRRALARSADDAVNRALAALNIPTRHEVRELSRRVEQLSKRVEGLRR